MYVDGYLIPIKKNKVKEYKKMAQLGYRMWRKHGALDYKECVGDDLASKWGLPFTKLLKLKPGQTAIWAYVVFKSRAHRDKVNAAVMKEMEKLGVPPKMPFDPRFMSVGGFKVLVP
jgi:uncharacterized protein YbaA (DUF1428 family)